MPERESAVTPGVVASVLPLVPVWRVDRMFDYLIPEKLAGKVERGSLVRVPFGHRFVRGIVTGLQERPATQGELQPIKSVVVAHPLMRPPLDALFTWLAERYTTPRGVAFERVVPPRVRVKPREGAPLAQVVPTATPRYDGGTELLASLAAGESRSWCFQTLPGADRGALIAELVAAAPDTGAVLVAVPEVRYGSHVLDHLMRVFPSAGRVDSSVSDQDRSSAWVSLAAGSLRLGLGGRSAVLAPAAELSLIVLDEEDHRTYKEDRSPRYDARRVAMERARIQDAACVLLSSAPSLETGHAAEDGTLGWVRPRRADSKAARPIVELAEPPASGLSTELHAAVRDTLRDGGRVALLSSAAGYARALWCASCRRSVRCPRCEAGVATDQAGVAVRCPRCGWSHPAPRVCPKCGSEELRSLGAGSERLAEQVTKAFPRVRVQRVDPNVLDAEDGKPDVGVADIYVTTWIGTKEALRPDVSLVGVLDADALIRRPDFRASENAFHALWEMAEWAGPASAGGRLVIQTSEPGHHVIQAVVRADYGFFLSRESEQREELGYPPFSELIKVRFSGANPETWIDRVINAAGAHGARALGPVPVRTPEGDHQELLLKCPDAATVASELRVILPDVPSGIRMRVDVDPR